MSRAEILDWLLSGDVSIQYQTHRDLLSNVKLDLRKRIAKEGFGAKFLAQRKENGHWGMKFYQPKWISTHYTLLDLKNLGIDPSNEQIKQSIRLVLDTEKATDGGILPIGKNQLSDICVNGMVLNYASYFGASESDLQSIIDCIVSQIMPDGGFNCMSNRTDTFHSSLHSTLSVLEGLYEYQRNGYTYEYTEVQKAIKLAIEFILIHQLFISDRTGQVIRKDFLKLTYPSRWKYDILRALDFFQYADVRWDERMAPAIQVILKKRNRDNTWNVQAKHPGKVHFEMEQAGKPSRWNTLRVLRVFKHFGIEA